MCNYFLSYGAAVHKFYIFNDAEATADAGFRGRELMARWDKFRTATRVFDAKLPDGEALSSGRKEATEVRVHAPRRPKEGNNLGRGTICRRPSLHRVIERTAWKAFDGFKFAESNYADRRRRWNPNSISTPSPRRLAEAGSGTGFDAVSGGSVTVTL